ncbi:hypothetical protein [Dyella tabacisoli]|nr:hypothetical protein [Dyella tabacisoli]
MTPGATTPTASTSTAQATIPYRTETPVSGGRIVVAMSVTAIVLMLFVALAWYARRRGWNGSWLSGASLDKRPQDRHALQVHASRRVSVATSVHVLGYRGREYLIVESTRGSSARVVMPDSDERHTDAAL